MGEEERSGDGRKTSEEVDAGALFVLKSKDLVYVIDKSIIYITEDNGW